MKSTPVITGQERISLTLIKIFGLLLIPLSVEYLAQSFRYELQGPHPGKSPVVYQRGK